MHFEPLQFNIIHKWILCGFIFFFGYRKLLDYFSIQIKIGKIEFKNHIFWFYHIFIHFWCTYHSLNVKKCRQAIIRHKLARSISKFHSTRKKILTRCDSHGYRKKCRYMNANFFILFIVFIRSRSCLLTTYPSCTCTILTITNFSIIPFLSLQNRLYYLRGLQKELYNVHIHTAASER